MTRVSLITLVFVFAGCLDWGVQEPGVDGDADSDGDVDTDVDPDSAGDADAASDADLDVDEDVDEDNGGGGDADGDIDGGTDADADHLRDADDVADADEDEDTEMAVDADVDLDVERDTDVENDSECIHPEVVESCAGGWCSIPAGCFMMGSPDDEFGRESIGMREPQHEVSLTRDFEIQSTEVTQEQFEAVMGYNPSHFASCPACPVEMVNWHEAAAFCNTLSTTAGLSRCYECWGGSDEVNCTPTARYANPYDCPGYRLPTEAEWEYAVRSGDTMATYNGELDVSGCVPSPVLAPIAWYCGNSDSTPHPVGDLDPNAWGLYDMLGSVFEWCHDWYRAYPSGSLTDPWGPLTGSERILRGGSWRYHAQRVRAADRGRGTSVHAGWDHIGFRPARTMP